MKFELNESDRLIINPAYLLVPELRMLWESDKNKDKATANIELKYIFLVCHVDSPLRLKSLEQRKEGAYKMIGKRIDLSLEGKKAFNAMMELRETSEYNLIDDIVEKIEEYRKLYKSTTITAENAKQVKDYLAFINEMIDEREKLKKRIEQKALKTSVRGGYEPTPLSKGDIDVASILSERKKKIKEKKANEA
jgi:hypothetical protein